MRLTLLKHLGRITFGLRRQFQYQTIPKKRLMFNTFALSFMLYGIGQQKQLNCIEDSIIKNARNKIEKHRNQLQKQYGNQVTTYPETSCTYNGHVYKMEFVIDQRKCDLLAVLLSAINVLESNKEQTQFTITKISSSKDKSREFYILQIDFTEAVGNPKSRMASKGTLHIAGEYVSDMPQMKLTFEKSEEISDLDIQAFCEAYNCAVRPRAITNLKNFSSSASFKQTQTSAPQQQEVGESSEAIKKLEELGVTVIMPDNKERNLDWDYLAGYEKQKRDIEDTVLLALSHPDVYDEITKGTRVKNEPNRPKAVLFEGPPGTGKTTSAKIIAQQVKIPLIYLPIESVLSKYYGESEKRFADVWDACKMLGKCIIFIDEIDAIAQQRDSQMHEASRRILSTLLRKIDSFESTTNVLLICATNRKQDLDQAMLSRLDLSVKFELPDVHARTQIYQRYAKHLKEQERKLLAEQSVGMSGRNISDICKGCELIIKLDAERRWASKLIRKETQDALPNLQQYIEALNQKNSL